MMDYIKVRYGDPNGALAFHLAHNYYAKGGVVSTDEIMPGQKYKAYGGITWGEGHGGEAYIPLGAGQRSHSMKLLSAVANKFGMSLTPRGIGGIAGKDSIANVAGGSKAKWIPPAPIIKAAVEDMLNKMVDSGAAGNVDSMIRMFNRNNTVGQKIDPKAAAAARLAKNREIGFGGDLAALGRKGVSAELIEQIRGMGESGYELAATLNTSNPMKLSQFIKAAGGGTVGGMYVPDAGSPPSINDAAAAALGLETGASGGTVTHIHIHGSLVTEKEMYENAYQYGVHRDKRTGKFGRR